MRALRVDFLAEHYDIGRGVRQRIAEIDEAITRQWRDALTRVRVMSPHTSWWGFFDEIDTVLLFRQHHRVYVQALVQDNLPHNRISFDSKMTTSPFPGLHW